MGCVGCIIYLVLTTDRILPTTTSDKVQSAQLCYASSWILATTAGCPATVEVRAANDPSVLNVTEKAPTRAFSWLKAPNS